MDGTARPICWRKAERKGGNGRREGEGDLVDSGVERVGGGQAWTPPFFPSQPLAGALNIPSLNTPQG